MAHLTKATIINSRLFPAGTEYRVRNVRPAKGGRIRVTIEISGVSLTFNTFSGSEFDFTDKRKLVRIVDESNLIENEKCTGEDKRVHLEVMHSAIEMGLRGEQIVVGDIFEWHRRLFDSKGHGGMIRNVGAYASGNLHRYVEPDQIRRVLYNLIDHYDWSDSSWESIANAHWEYTDVHAFYDGNGRTARILLNWHAVFTGHNPVCICFADRAEYIDLLYNKDIAGLAALFANSEMF